MCFVSVTRRVNIKMKIFVFVNICLVYFSLVYCILCMNTNGPGLDMSVCPRDSFTSTTKRCIEMTSRQEPNFFVTETDHSSSQINAKGCGNLELIIGPMYSGKTTELIRRVKRFQLAGKNVLCISFLGDERSNCPFKITSHSNQYVDAKRCLCLMDVISEAKKHTVVAIDEVQFFNDVVEFCDELCLNGVRVICAGLNGTFARSPWPNISNLIAIADSISLLSAICETEGCGQEAPFSYRHTSSSNSKPQDGASEYTCSITGDINPRTNRNDVAIGGKEMYSAKCRSCYTNTL